MKGTDKQISWANDIIANGLRAAIKDVRHFVMGSIALKLRKHNLTLDDTTVAKIISLIGDANGINIDKLTAVVNNWTTNAAAGDIIDDRYDNTLPIAAAVAAAVAAL